jgi:hypothetical protein
MALPKLNQRIYHTVLSNGKKISYRPMLAKEQKLLIAINETKNMNELVQLIAQIINNCILNEDVDIETMTMPDLEKMIILIRSKSVSEILELEYRCKNEIEDGKICNHISSIEVNLEEVNINGEIPNNTIMLDEKIGVILKPPTVRLFFHVNFSNESEFINQTIRECITAIFDENTVYNIKNISKEEYDEFLESLTLKQLNEIADWFKNLPSIHHEFEFKCKKCGFKTLIELNGLSDFFG